MAIDHSTELASPAWFPGVWLSPDSPGSQLLCSGRGRESGAAGTDLLCASSRPSLLQMEGQPLPEQETGSEAVRPSWLTLETPGNGEGKKRGK